MLLVILLCLHAPHCLVEGLRLHSRVGGDVQLLGTVLFRPSARLMKKYFSNALAPHILGYMEACKVKILFGSSEQGFFYGGKSLQNTVAEKTIDKAARSYRIFETGNQKLVIRF